MMPEPWQGQVWWATLDPVEGREQGGRRPVVVISGDEYHAMADTMVIVVAVTTTDRQWVEHVRLTGPTGLSRDSWAMTEQVRTISRRRLVKFAGAVDDECLGAIRGWVLDHLR